MNIINHLTQSIFQKISQTVSILSIAIFALIGFVSSNTPIAALAQSNINDYGSVICKIREIRQGNICVPINTGPLATITIDGQVYLDVQIAINRPVINSGEDNILTVLALRFGDNQPAGFYLVNIIITTPTGKKIVFKASSDQNGNLTANLSPNFNNTSKVGYEPLKLASVERYTEKLGINPAATNIVNPVITPLTLVSGDVSNLKELGNYNAYITATSDNKEQISKSVSWQVITPTNNNPQLIRTGSDIEILLQGMAVCLILGGLSFYLSNVTNKRKARTLRFI
jgi:hypothetical protein